MTQHYYEDIATKLAANMSATRPNTAMDVIRVTDLSGTTLAVNFDVRVENEILRVTAITVDGGGTGIDRWTASHIGGAAASTHGAGQEVEVILTAHALENDLSSVDDDSAYMPLAGGTFTGDVEFEAQIVDDTESSGSDGDVLTKVSGHPRWAADAGGGGGFSNPMTTKGDIIYEDAGPAPARLALAATDGWVLTVNHATGLPEWRAAAGGGGGASTADHFIVGMGGEGDTDLSAKVIVPGLSGSPDIRVAGGNDDEFDQNGSGTPAGWTLFGVDSPTARTDIFKSHLKLTANSHSSHSVNGINKAMPGGAATITAKLSDTDCNANFSRAGIFIGDGSTSGKIVGVGWSFADGKVVYTNFSDWGTFGGTNTGVIGGNPPVYLRLVFHSASNIDVQVSFNGMAWHDIQTGVNYLAAGDHYGMFIDSDGTAARAAYYDWIRLT